jgi:nicotinamide riboside transporter PnuC
VFDWVLAVVGVTGIFFVGRKTIWGWLILCVNECLWIAYGLTTGEHGFIAMAIAYAIVYIKSYFHWRKEESEEKLMYNEINTHGQIDHRYIK